jgi:AbrB family transcriptional regulator (stage V sporulation protein T)
MRIREGDPLEIYTDSDGEVIFKKYSPIGEISPWAAQYAEVLSKTAGFPVLICDSDHVVAASGVSKKEYLERRVSSSLENLLEERKSFVLGQGGDKFLPAEGIDRSAVAVFPIISSGDITGAVVLLENDGGTAPKESEIKLAQVAAGFLSKQMEE